MLQEVVLKVVTPPTFTNTSESEVRVETGRPAALFCHAEGITNNIRYPNITLYKHALLSGEPRPVVTWTRADGSMLHLQVGQIVEMALTIETWRAQ